MLKVNAMGDTCPIPVVKTKEAIRQLGADGGVVETLVDNDIAVQNLTKMANQKGYGVESEKLGENEYRVTMTVGAGVDLPAESEETVCMVPTGQKNTVVVVAADHMGEGEGELGKNLLKAFLYALSQQESLPKTILFYNDGASLTCQGSLSLEDLKSMAERGVEILTCGTCLNFYGLTEKLAVGGVTNMYDIVEKQMAADLIVRP
ncbi:MAG TPA: sulfurtransferase-like selenium metabolism protein YedF [Oscillibacter sp.]|nr:sulfurtransferase-like selenium metabolism protein YedF [Oscillibacter sp.]